MKARIFFVAIAVWFAFGSCARKETTHTETQVQQEQSLESRLAQLRAEVDTLDAKAKGAGESLRVETSEAIAQLKAQRDSAQVRLDRLKSASSEAWENVKAGTDEALGNLELAIAGARERLHSRADTTRTP